MSNTEALHQPPSAAVSCSACCGGETVIFKAAVESWDVAGSAVYDDDARERIEGLDALAFPDVDAPSIYCEACSLCGRVSRGWVEPHDIFNPWNAEDQP